MKINKMGIFVLLLSLGFTIVPISLNLNGNISDNNYNQIDVLSEVFEDEGTNPPTDDIALPDQESGPTSDLPKKSQVDPEEEEDINKKTKPSIIATIDIKPDTLCSRSRGRWIRVFIELETGYDIQDINVSSILLNDTISPLNCSIKYGDYDEDGIADLQLIFNRSELIDFLQDYEENTVDLTIEGKLNNDTSFTGSDAIKLVHFNNYRCHYHSNFYRRCRNQHYN